MDVNSTNTTSASPMESSLVISYSTVSEPHDDPETLDYLSTSWCNFALQTLQENNKMQSDGSLVLVNDLNCCATTSVNTPGTGNLSILSSDFLGLKIDEERDILPPWKSNDLKSWIWMQQALHPELNYNNTYFDTKRWFTGKINPLKNSIKPIKKWLKKMKQNQKEKNRLKKAELHSAISIASLATALAAIAESENLKTYNDNDDDKISKGSVVASAASLVASQCVEVAYALGATKEQLADIVASAEIATNSSDILTLTAAAATSIRGADKLKARKHSTSKMISRTSTELSIKKSDDDDEEEDFDFQYGKSLLSKGALLNIQKLNGKFSETWVSIDLNSKAEVILKMKQLKNLFILKTFSTMKECIVMDIHVELYTDEDESYTTCYLIVLETNRGMIKLDMSCDYECYKMWMLTLKRMLMMSLSLARIM